MPGQRPGSTEHTTRHLPTRGPGVGGSVVLAMLIHGVIALTFLGALSSPRYFEWLVMPHVSPDTVVERVRYVELKSVAPPPAATPLDPSPPIAPAATTRSSPDAIPDASLAGAPSSPLVLAPAARIDSGSVARVDDDGPTGVMLRPQSADPRIWSARSGTSPEPLSPPGTSTGAHLDAVAHAAMLEGTLARRIVASNDSIAALGVQTVRPDWVATRGDHSYGMDNTAIHLGKVKLPAVLLGLLPINGFGCMPTMYFPDRAVRDSIGISCIQLENSTVTDRNERIAEMGVEIRARAPLALSAGEERARIAARKDRERDARIRAQGSAPRPP